MTAPGRRPKTALVEWVCLRCKSRRKGWQSRPRKCYACGWDERYPESHGMFPELLATGEHAAEVITAEEQKFSRLVARGAKLVLGEINRARREGRSVIDGATAFRFHDTHGIPVDITRDIAADEGFVVDEDSFREHLNEQRERSRADRKKNLRGAPTAT